MEIKKYVLLDEECNNAIMKNDKVVLKERGFYSTNKFDGIEYFTDYKSVIKTSDNILDLVEKGDLIEHDEYEDDLRKVVSNNKIGTVYLIGGEYMFYENIIAIYKLQPNGDYKKYEVE